MTVTALAAAPAAREWLACTATASVLHVFERACNLVNPAGEVLSLVSGKRGLTPFALLLPAAVPPLFSGVTETSAVRVEAGRLQVGPLIIDWTGTPAWNPMPDWVALRRFFAVPAALADLAAEAARVPARGSLLTIYGGIPDGGTVPSPLADRLQAGMRAMVEGVSSRSTAIAIEGALGLAGVGGGLTPAGDDFITGVLLAIWAGLYGAGLEPLAESLAEAASTRTTTLSGAYLRAAARGECSAPWHALFEALLGGGSSGRRRALEALLAVGHTSGGDGLAGFLASHFLVTPLYMSH
jgi:hypothetical protein